MTDRNLRSSRLPSSFGKGYCQRVLPPGIKNVLLSVLLVIGWQTMSAQIHVLQPAGSGSSPIISQGTPVIGTPVLPVITGGTTICVGTSTILTNATTGGVWSSANTAVATVNPSTGQVYGVYGGVTNISYAVGSLSISTTLTVTYPITGASAVCVGNSIFLTDTTATGIWASSNTALATVLPTGEVKGISAGAVTITFGRTGACYVTQTVTVGANSIGAIGGTGVLAVCAGGAITATDTTAAGIWSSSNTALASINASTGAITGIVAGAVTITYSASGCYITKPLTVTAPTGIASITGPSSVCVGNNAALNDVTPLGTWSSSNTATAIVNAAGTVTGISPGTVTISYSKGGCSVTQVVTVNANNIGPITGGTNVCIGQTDALSDTTSGGTWSINNTALAALSGSIITGVSAGSPIITYSVGGCSKTITVLVNPTTVAGAIMGVSTLCQGTTTTFTDITPGGTWSSGNTGIATVNAYGLVTGIAAGTDTIYFTRLGCVVMQQVVVNASPSAITGAKRECAANSSTTSTLADATSGGTWTSSTTTVATVNPATGIVSAITQGVTVITYTAPATGCFVTATDTVYGPVPISGGTNACIAPLTYLYLADGTSGGVWTSTQTTKASVASTGIVTAALPGLDTIKYTMTYFTGFSCYVYQPISVAYAPGLISGRFSTCIGASTTLTDTTSAGIWSSANGAIATVGSSTGVVTGVGSGGVAISYTINGCTKTANVTVGALLPAITGSNTVCVGLATTTLTSTTTGGSWSASNPFASITGTGTGAGSTSVNITGVTAGTDTIYYSKGGCSVNKTVTVTANSATSVTGLPVVCTGLTSVQTSGGGAGNWTSGNPLVASFSGSTTGTSAAVLGVSAGTTVITYTLTSNGCFKTTVLAVHNQPASVTGAYTVCNAATTALTDATSGGSWTSSDTHKAVVSSSGVVSGISIGHVTITYTMPGGCETYQPLAITGMPYTIGGTAAACLGSTTSLSDSLIGGKWTSTNYAVATIDSMLGVVTGVAGGTATITYTVGSCFVTKAVTVGSINPTITSSPITVCANGTGSTAMTVSNSGGAWATSNALVAAVSSGVVTGISIGTSMITYTLNGCYATQVATVTTNTMPGITGNTAVCAGSTSTLAEAVTGGTWASSITTVATIGAGSGVIGGVASGSVIVTYAVASGGCRQFLSVNVGSVTPASIAGGTSAICAGGSAALTDPTSGGYWSSSNSTIAYVNSYGTVVGLAAGNANISYAISGCYPAPVTITVNPLPGAITGTLSVCENAATTALSDTSSGGTWSSSATSKATVSSAGVVTGVLFGSTTISYTLSTGCVATASVAVGGNASGVGGPSSVCGGNQITLTAVKSGGVWTSSNPAIAQVSGSTVTGIANGIVTMSYTTPGCAAVAKLDTVNFVAPILGSYSVCKTDSVTLTDASSGGTWTSTNTTIATVNSLGMIYGVNAGADTITYTMSGGCNVIQQIYVNGCGHRAGPELVGNELENQAYTLYPNPSSGKITIAQSLATDGIIQVSVVNYVGKTIYSGPLEFRGGTSNLNISAAPGVYLILLQDNNGSTKNLKAIVN